MKIASKGSRPTHRIVHDKLWDVDRAACGASTWKYKVAAGTADDVTCLRCKAEPVLSSNR